MAFLSCNFHSMVIEKETSFNVIMPQAPLNGEQPPYKVLYLLHGLSDNYSNWMRNTAIERYARAYNLIVVMPDGGRGFYTDAKRGFKYWTMISEELPKVVSNMFNASTKREDTFAAGLSMGGYGALKLALRNPHQFSAAVGISSVADIRELLTKIMPGEEMSAIFGTEEDLVKDQNDLLALAESTAKLDNPPRIMSICGTEDFLYNANTTFRQKMEAINYPGYIYREGPGAHTWDFWDTWIAEALKFFMDK